MGLGSLHLSLGGLMQGDFLCQGETRGAGGLGDVAIRYGYQRYIASMMYASIIVTVIIVQLFQFVGNYLAKRVDKR